MLSKQTLLRLTELGLLPKHTLRWRFKDDRFEYLHATKGWRGRSLRSLCALGVFRPA